MLLLSMYEQELVAANGDVKFLGDTMDEMREAESTYANIIARAPFFLHLSTTMTC